MTLAIAAAMAVALAGIWLWETRAAKPATTEDIWWRVVALHMQQATPKRRL